jgi:hypothetical protein
VIAAPVVLDAAYDDAARVRLALPVAHDAESVRQAIHAAQVVHDAPKPPLTLKTTSHRSLRSA